MDEAATTFVLLRPGWLLAIPVLWALVLLTARRLRDAGWGRRIAADKLAHLRQGAPLASRRRTVLIGGALTLACLALAGPSWRLSPDALAGDRRAMVLLLDLSPSMLARDVAPNRLTRARLKVIDLLRARGDGDSALIVYADDAFRVAPLTDDPAVIETLVPTLGPDIMPRAGSRPEAAVALALTLFDGAGLERGDIVAVTDGMHPDAVAAIDERLPEGFRLSILGVGTAAGAPVPTADGGHLRDARGERVLAALDEGALASLASRSGGRYSSLTNDGSDVERLLALDRLPLDPRRSDFDTRFDERDDAGYWLVLALLPIVALGFRRNALWMTVPLMLTLPPDGHAFDWQGLWLTDDQRGARALERGDADEAAERFESVRWRAIARYRAGDHAGAAELLARSVTDGSATADDHYNLGNALALAGALPDALIAYERALTLYPPDDPRAGDARANRTEVQSLIDARERDAEEEARAGTPPRGGGDGDDERTGDEEEAAEEERADGESATSRTAVGGRSGGGEDTLAQQALDGESRSSDGRRAATGDPEPGVPDDATPVADRRAASGTGELPDGRDADTASPRVEPNANRVLTPYGERWLRELPRDPGGYLRRKFHYLAETRASTAEPAPTRSDERF